MYQGLSEAEVKVRQHVYGGNVLPAKKHRFFKLLLRQFKGAFNLLLIIAAAITFSLGEPIDGSFILFFIFFGIGLTLFQEFKSNAAAEKLKSYLVSTITVRRGGEDKEVSVTELVPGDVIRLESGDIVPADGFILHALNFQVDESTFTGESVSVFKQAKSGEEIFDYNQLLQGVRVISGSAYIEVTATGQSTKLAKIAEAAAVPSEKSELNKGVDKISGFVVKVTVITLIFVVIANLLIEGSEADLPHLLIFAIALALSAIPEALPLVMTFSLSRGALNLAKKHVIVKRLSSVQDLGSIELLCTDKTGTITENKLVYQNQYLIPRSPFHPLFLARLASQDLHERVPEPFDLAIDNALDAADRDRLSNYDVVEEEAFEPNLRSNGVILADKNGGSLHIRRGSPEYFIEQSLISREVVGSWLEAEENQGRRVLGVSYDFGSGPQFGGFVSFSDTLKKTTAATLAAARDLNVAVTIITGDSFLVARAIGKEVGLVTKDEEVIEANHFFALGALEQKRLIRNIRVFARTTPEQKLALIQILKEYFTVGFLGEGINDAPALKAASVSMVVQSASDVARETADIILLKSNLGVIIEGIKLGRETHANTLKYIRATLVSNFGNFYAVAIGSLFISFLPMLPKQLLLLNMLSDLPMIAIAFDRVSAKEISRPQKYNYRSLYIIFITLGLVSTIFDFMWFALFYQISPGVLQTNWFIASALTEIMLLISIRSMLPLEQAGRPAPVLVYLSVGAIILTILIPIIPVTAAFFEFTPPSLAHLALIVSLAFVYLITSEAVKRPVAKFISKQE